MMNAPHFNYQHFSNEMKLLLACCFYADPPTQKATIHTLIQAGVNWFVFFQLAKHHHVLPLISFHILGHAAELIPSEFLTLFKKKIAKQKLHSIKLTAEMLNVVKLMQAHQIPIIPLKGPLLAYFWYGDVSLRHFVDLDFFIAENDIPRIHELLKQQGYHTVHPEIFTYPVHWQVFKNSKHHIPYHSTTTGITLEFHFRLFKNPYIFPGFMPFQGHSLETQTYSGMNFLTLETMDHILYLVLHGAIHQWRYLKWLVDLAYWSVLPGSDWEKVYSRAQSVGLERPVIQCLLLLNHLFALPLPAWFNTLKPGKTVHYLTRYTLRALFLSQAFVKGGLVFACRERYYLWQLRRGMRYKSRYIRDLFYLDSHRRILRLPGFLFPLYILLNPFIWFYKNYLVNKKKAVPQVTPKEKW